ncbi:MAG: M23 family metallopeptidase [Minicystis sp.]
MVLLHGDPWLPGFSLFMRSFMPGNKWAGQGPDTPVTDVSGGGGGGEGYNSGKNPQSDGQNAAGSNEPATDNESKRFTLPVAGGRLTGSWLESRPDGTSHKGVDIAAPMGTPVHAAGAGTVILNRFDKDSSGWIVVIDHGSGLTSGYCHMMKQSPLKVGAKVKKSQVLGAVGSTGKSTGPHLHLFIKKGDTSVNPGLYVDLPSEK